MYCALNKHNTKYKKTKLITTQQFNKRQFINPCKSILYPYPSSLLVLAAIVHYSYCIFYAC